MTRYHDARLRVPGAYAHRTTLKGEGVDLDQWLETYEHQDGRCYGCSVESVYLVLMPPQFKPEVTRLPEQTLICKSCRTYLLADEEEATVQKNRVAFRTQLEETIADYEEAQKDPEKWDREAYYKAINKGLIPLTELDPFKLSDEEFNGLGTKYFQAAWTPEN